MTALGDCENSLFLPKLVGFCVYTCERRGCRMHLCRALERFSGDPPVLLGIMSDEKMSRGKRADEPIDSKWSPRPMDTYNTRKVTIALPASWEEIEYPTKTDGDRLQGRSGVPKSSKSLILERRLAVFFMAYRERLKIGEAENKTVGYACSFKSDTAPPQRDTNVISIETMAILKRYVSSHRTRYVKASTARPTDGHGALRRAAGINYDRDSERGDQGGLCNSNGCRAV
ncbi:hypothetical protein EVAR_60544_1 [Eumeta japonica]|uniref:Uncharacterized protein n=1 Tax=Eumeta variegata TaxID=151549 RepID=A0A4C1YVV2_EUMVA|nr:hypothetical protein EVAR_60544_1 [Eumeta japonica]